MARLSWLALLSVGLVAVSAGPAGGRPPKPATVARVSGLVYAVAQSRTVEAWRLCDRIELRSPAGRRLPTIVLRRNVTVQCSAVAPPGSSSHYYGDPIHRDVLLLTGNTVVWSLLFRGNDTSEVSFEAAAATTGKAVPSRLPGVWHDSFGGWVTAGPASDGRTIVFGATRVDWDSRTCGQDLLASDCLSLGTASITVGDGVSRSGRVLRKAAALVAVAGGRVAFVPGVVDPNAGLVPRAEIDVVTTSGSPLGSMPVPGTPLELAMSAATIVVMTETPDRRVDWFDARTLAPIGSVDVVSGSHGLGVAGRRIVYADGRRILCLGPGDSSSRVLATAAVGSVVVGPVVTGTRVLWAEVNRARRTSTVRTLVLA